MLRLLVPRTLRGRDRDSLFRCRSWMADGELARPPRQPVGRRELILPRWIRFLIGMGAGFFAGALLPLALQLMLFLALSVLLLCLLRK